MRETSLLSLNGRYDALYLRNYATLQLKDVLSRIPGVGQATVFGSGDYAMRVWLDPAQLSSRGLMASDVVNAIREQNVQVAGGIIGAQPVVTPTAFQLIVNVRGRLESADEFGDIIVRTDGSSRTTHVRDVARVQLGAGDYSLRSALDNKQSSAIGIFQAPGSNQLALAGAIEAKMHELKQDFPPGLDYDIAYNTTTVVEESIADVVRTLLIAIGLVAVVVVVFLHTGRASLIPLAAVRASFPRGTSVL